MNETVVDKRVSGVEGETETSVTSTSQMTTDPVTGGTVRSTSTRMWAGKNVMVETIWLVAGVILLFLAGDFVFHAFGANNVGFAAFVYSIGSFFAAPFAGIFNTSTTAPGNLVIWADILGMAVYAIVAGILAKIAAIASAKNA